jgi:hypothetical protein
VYPRRNPDASVKVVGEDLHRYRFRFEAKIIGAPNSVFRHTCRTSRKRDA